MSNQQFCVGKTRVESSESRFREFHQEKKKK
ncbi:hypothetical protein G210_4969 [Candida maltosa Xu316]|uniref:Uncharacterized protein n=1 Tax=Candida maltosa (strain Xu316) TaxID=1245528 RepID=M3JCX6_CANMX|nr:hypothetical protein G210_4969 [Candida maltosa Xu316]